MSSKVIVFVADEAYLPHYKAVAVNCMNEGQYDGDFLWIVPNTHEPWILDLLERGFHVLGVEDRGVLAKFDGLDPFLGKWDHAMYLDGDVSIQLPLHPLFYQLTNWPMESPNRRRILAMREDVPVFMGWQLWDKDWQSHTEIYEKMSERFPFVNADLNSDKMWNTAIMLYEPASIPVDTVEQLRALQDEFFVCNDPAKGGTDEPIIDLLLHHHFAQIAEKGWTHWGLDNENARVPSISRGWRGGEVPVILHFTRWYAQWIKKEPEMDAYASDRLGRVYHELYAENLKAFDKAFPLHKDS